MSIIENKLGIIKKRPHPIGYHFDIENISSHLFLALKEDRDDIYFLIKPSIIDKKDFGPLKTNNIYSEFKKLSIELNGKKEETDFFIVRLLNIDLKHVLFFWVKTFLYELNNSTKSSEVNNRIIGFIDLFQKSKEKNRSALGLWGELFIIWNSKNPSLYVDSWAKDTKEKLDFTFNNIGLDVKTTTRDKRLHPTKYNQIFRLNNTFIASITAIQADDQGKSIKDFQKELNPKLSQKQNSKISEIILDTLSNYPNFHELVSKKRSNGIAENTLSIFEIESKSKKEFSTPDYVIDDSLSFEINLSNSIGINQDNFTRLVMSN